MSVGIFQLGADNDILTQPSATSKVYARSDNGADTTQTLTVYDEAGSNEALSLNGLVEQVTTATFADVKWAILSATATGTVSLFSEDTGVAGIGDIRIDTQPSDGHTIDVGLAADTITYTFKTTVAADRHVKIGATTSETADNLASAINDASTGTSTPVDGTDWQNAGTAPAGANAYLSATVVTNIVTITDRMKCKRASAWQITETVGFATIRSPISGRDGSAIATFATGETTVYDGALVLDSADLLTETLPASVTGATDAITLNGRKCRIRFLCEDVTTAIALKYEFSDDDGTPTNWTDGATAITSLDNVLTPVSYLPSEEHMMHIRLNITANANTSATKLDARVIF